MNRNADTSEKPPALAKHGGANCGAGRGRTIRNRGSAAGRLHATHLIRPGLGLELLPAAHLHSRAHYLLFLRVRVCVGVRGRWCRLVFSLAFLLLHLLFLGLTHPPSTIALADSATVSSSGLGCTPNTALHRALEKRKRRVHCDS